MRRKLGNWIKFPGYSTWDAQANGWMQNVADSIQGQRWWGFSEQGVDPTESYYKNWTTSNRIQDQYLFAGKRELFMNGVRVSLENEDERLEYMNNGGTEIGRWERVGGYLELKRTESTVPGFYTGWSNYGGAFHTIRARKDANGFVHLEGLVSQASGASGSICQLPVGYRPASQVLTITQKSTGSGRIDVLTSGNVNPSVLPGAGGWVSLDNITFYAGH